MTNGDIKQNICPFCEKSVDAGTIKCPHCTCVIQTDKDLVEGEVCGDIDVLSAAIIRLRKEINDHPRKGILYYYLGLAMKDRGLITASKDNFEKAMDLSPEIPGIYYELFWIYKFQGNIPRSVDYIKQAVNLDRDNVQYNLNGGINLKRRGEKLMALECLERAEKKAPDNTLVLSELGAVYFELNKMDKAQRIYEKWLSIEPDSEEALKFLSEIYDNQQNDEGIIQINKNLLERDPDNLDRLYLLAYKLKEAGNLDESIAYFEKLAEKNPGYVHEKHSRLEETPKIILASCYLAKSESLLKEEKYDEALVFLEKSLELNPKCPSVYQILGDLYFNKKKIPLEMIQKIFEDNIVNVPQNDFILTNLALMYQEQGNTEKAQLYLGKCRSYKSAYSKEVLEAALLDWSKVLEDSNKLDGAIQKMEQVLEFTQNPQKAQSRVEMLRSKWRADREKFYVERQKRVEERERKIREKRELEEREQKEKIARRKRLVFIWTSALGGVGVFIGITAMYIYYLGMKTHHFNMNLTIARNMVLEDQQPLEAIDYLLDYEKKLKPGKYREIVENKIGTIIARDCSFMQLNTFVTKHPDSKWAEIALAKIHKIVKENPLSLSYGTLEDLVLKKYRDSSDRETIYEALIGYYDVKIQDRNKTVSYIKKMIREFPKNKNILQWKIRIAEIYQEKYNSDLTEDSFDAAVKWLEDIIRTYPGVPGAMKARYMLATCYDPNFSSPFPDVKKAVKMYKKIINDDPSGPFAAGAGFNISQLGK